MKSNISSLPNVHSTIRPDIIWNKFGFSLSNVYSHLQHYEFVLLLMCLWWYIVIVGVQYVCLCQSELAVLGHWRHTCASLSPSSREVSSQRADWLMTVILLLCLWPKTCQTRAITPHCPPPFLALLNSTPTPFALGKRKTPSPPAEDAELTNPLSLCLPHSVFLILLHTLTHMQRDFACVRACVQQDWS